MTSHTEQYAKLQNVEFGSDKMYPMASIDSFDENDEAQEKRREERRKRKQSQRRDKSLPIEEGDPDILLQAPKKQKRPKKKQQVPDDLWYDDSLDEELDDINDDDDWEDEWDS